MCTSQRTGCINFEGPRHMCVCGKQKRRAVLCAMALLKKTVRMTTPCWHSSCRVCCVVLGEAGSAARDILPRQTDRGGAVTPPTCRSNASCHVCVHRSVWHCVAAAPTHMWQSPTASKSACCRAHVLHTPGPVGHKQGYTHSMNTQMLATHEHEAQRRWRCNTPVMPVNPTAQLASNAGSEALTKVH